MALSIQMSSQFLSRGVAVFLAALLAAAAAPVGASASSFYTGAERGQAGLSSRRHQQLLRWKQQQLEQLEEQLEEQQLVQQQLRPIPGLTSSFAGPGLRTARRNMVSRSCRTPGNKRAKLSSCSCCPAKLNVRATFHQFIRTHVTFLLIYSVMPYQTRQVDKCVRSSFSLWPAVLLNSYISLSEVVQLLKFLFLPLFSFRSKNAAACGPAAVS